MPGITSIVMFKLRCNLSLLTTCKVGQSLILSSPHHPPGILGMPKGCTRAWVSALTKLTLLLSKQVALLTWE